jgi:hypothetical protein
MLPRSAAARLGSRSANADSGGIVHKIAIGLAAPVLFASLALVFKRTGLPQRLIRSGGDRLDQTERLRKAILGNSRHAIAAAMGPPQGSAGTASPKTVFLADCWYYRLDHRRGIAVAIEFRKDVACEVQVMHLDPRARLAPSR